MPSTNEELDLLKELSKILEDIQKYTMICQGRQGR
jgi:hypothetical protein